MSNEEDVSLENDKIKAGTKALDKQMEDPADNRETSAEYKTDSD